MAAVGAICSEMSEALRNRERRKMARETSSSGRGDVANHAAACRICSGTVLSGESAAARMAAGVSPGDAGAGAADMLSRRKTSAASKGEFVPESSMGPCMVRFFKAHLSLFRVEL